MKIALAQIDVKAGNPEANFATMRAMIERAKVQQVDIIAFPELCVGGYLIGDLHLDDEYCRYLMSFNDKIRELSDGIVIIYGNIYLEERDFVYKQVIGGQVKLHTRGFDGRKIRYNAAYAYYNKEILERDVSSDIIPKGIQPKMLLPTYRYFDDKRYFYSPINWEDNLRDCEKVSPFVLKGIKGMEFKIGVQLCEDMWKDDYRENPIIYLGHSDVIINLSASPWTYGKNKTRDRIVKNLLPWDEKGIAYDQNQNPIEHKIYPPYAYINCVGAQNNGKNILVFEGATTVYGQDGEPKILGRANYKQDLLIFDLEKIPKQTAIRDQKSKIEEKYFAVKRGIKHIIETCGIKKFVIGISGGIDSALVLSVLVEEIGANNIIAVNMPTTYNSAKTKNAAKKLCDNFKIRDYRIIPIQEIVDAKVKAIAPIGGQISGLAYENIQAETRAMILSGIAGNEKACFPCNGNKNEIAIGYFTVNADGRGAICPIADLTKAEIYDMGKFVNEEVYKKEMIPQEMLPNDLYQFTDQEKIQPSAELKDNQVDPIKIGYHCKLIEQFMDYKKIGPNQIMKWWIEGILHEKIGCDIELMKIYKVDDAKNFINDLKILHGRIRLSVFKRVQAPPIITLSKSAFGFDFRESILPVISPNFDEELEKKVLEKKTY